MGVEEEVPRSTATLVASVDPMRAKFPSSFYTIDIHYAFGFQRQGEVTVESQFNSFFQVVFRASTFYDHKARWLAAPQDARDKMVAAGYSDKGKYSVFMAAYPAKDAELKATKRKLRAVARHDVS